MATHKSAEKRTRQALRRRARNRYQRGRARSAVKQARAAIGSGDAEGAAQAVRNAESLLRRAASKGVIHWRRASRQISRLARAAQQAQ